MKKVLFCDLLEKRRLTKRLLFFPISIFLHLIIIGALIITPILNADNDTPIMKSISVLLSSPPSPSPPRPPLGKKGSSKKDIKVRSKKRVKRNSFKPTTLVAPFEVPDKIEEPDIEDFGEIEGDIDGIEGGVSRDEGGDKEGVLGSPLGEGYNISNAIYVTRVQKPKLIKKVNPVYPKIARKVGIKGRVIVEATTDAYGRVSIVKVINGHPLLNNAAITAIKQWVYEPYIVNGISKPVKFTVIVTFNLIR